MKLIPEQIAYLRKRKEELEVKKREYEKYFTTRESAGMEGIGAPHFIDYQEETSIMNSRRETAEVANLLKYGEFQTERNFDIIDIGTGFYVDFGDGEKERAVLIDKGTTMGPNGLFSSTESDFGKAVLGHKVGEQVSYTVQATGRKINLSILEIDRVKENYINFIRSKAYTDRVSQPVKKELAKLKVEDNKEYKLRQGITESQVELLYEEREKLSHNPASDRSRIAHIDKILAESIVLPNPTGEKIQVGSKVEIMLQDEGKTTHNFELINRAVSTELDSDYVERISTLGNSIYGLKAGDKFTVRRNHKPSLKGIIISVTNYKERVR